MLSTKSVVKLICEVPSTGVSFMVKLVFYELIIQDDAFTGEVWYVEAS